MSVQSLSNPFSPSTSTTPHARVLVVGCGEIGTRYLQAISSLNLIEGIQVVDPRAEGLQLGQKRLAETSDRTPSIAYVWSSSLDEVKKPGDLCIVSTLAKGRFSIVKRLAEEVGYKNFLLEKVVTQSLADYEALLALAQKYQLNIWINCKTRAYPFHKYASQKFNPALPIQFHVSAGNYGLATNGIHSIDLFAFYDRCQVIKPTYTQIDPVLQPSKRGSDLFDLSGWLQGESDKGSTFSIQYAQSHKAPDCYMVTNPEYRILVDHGQRWSFEADASTQWTWRPVPFEGNLFISAMSKDFVKDILTQGTCELPTLQDAFVAHAFLFKVVQPAFSKLLGRSLDYCPIT